MMVKEYFIDNIVIRHAIDEMPDDANFRMHLHERCEIYFLVSGNVEYLVEGSKYPLDEKNLMIMRPAETHKPKIVGEKRYERYAINFPISFANSIDPEGSLVKTFTERELGRNNRFTDSEMDMVLVEKLFHEMFATDDEYQRRITVKTHLLMLLDMISRTFSARENPKQKPNNYERIVVYVNNHLFEEISIPSLANHFYLSPSQFNRVFKQATGAAPWDYITKKRLTAAKEKIHNGVSAQTASQTCGFKDYSAFYRAYTKYFGSSPTNDNKKSLDFSRLGASDVT